MIFAILFLLCQKLMLHSIKDVSPDLAAATTDVDIMHGLLQKFFCCCCCLSDVMCSSLRTVLFKLPLRDK